MLLILYCCEFNTKKGIRQSDPFHPPFQTEIVMKQSSTYTGNFILELK
jgi:hypothetical protein